MESSGAKLIVAFSNGFILELCKHLEASRIKRADETLEKLLNFKKTIFRFSRERKVMLINGREVPEDEFNRVFYTLSLENLEKYGLQIEIPFENIAHETFGDYPVFLMNYTHNESERISSRYKVAVITNEELASEHQKLSLDWQFNKPILIKPSGRSSNAFDPKTELSPYNSPAKSVYLIDPYIGIWTEKQVRLNLCPILSSLYSTDGRDSSVQCNILIVTTFPKNYISPGSNSTVKVEERIKKITNLYNTLRNHFEPVQDIKIELICLDLHELELDYKSLRLIKQESQNFYAVQKHLKEVNRLRNISKSFFHDRKILSNYFTIDSGRSFDYNDEIDGFLCY